MPYIARRSLSRARARATTPLLLNLSAYDDITRIRLYAISDGGGIGWDTFTFDPEANHQVPEPVSTLLLLSTAMVGLAAARRRIRT